MLLNHPRRGGHIPRRQLENRFRRFQEGERIQVRRDDVRDRASRALRLAQLGELSAARQALEGA